MTDFLIYLSFSELGIGAIMFGVTWAEPKWLKDNKNCHAFFVVASIFLVFPAGHNLIGLGIWGLFTL